MNKDSEGFTSVTLLISPQGHYAGCPSYGPNMDNINLARIFKSKAHADKTNEAKYWGYNPVKARIKIELVKE